MNRRDLLKLISAASLSGLGTKTLANTKLRVVVAGAGIVGASIAYHLARSGVKVTVIDKSGPASEASRGTFAWINATWAKQPRSYHRINQQGLANWKTLAAELKLPIRWGGSIEWFEDEQRQARLAAQIEEQIHWGEPAEMIDAQTIARLEPNLRTQTQRAAFSANDGAVDPVLATQLMLDAIKKLGGNVIYPSELLDVTLAGDTLMAVQTSTGNIPADKLVLATGATENIVQAVTGLELPQRSTPGVIAISEPLQPLLQRIVVAPGVHLHQRADGRIVMGEQTGHPKNEAHEMRLQNRPNQFPAPVIAAQHAARILARALRFVPAIGDCAIDAVHIGWRPLPLDGLPVLGSANDKPDIYTAVMHSGVTLAPIVGQLVAHELITDTRDNALSAYRPTRAFSDSNRY